MLWNIILITILLLSISTILTIIFKKLPQLNKINPENISEYKENEIKKALIEKRFQRDVNLVRQKFLLLVKPKMTFVYNFFRKQYGKLYKIEEKYRKKLVKIHFEDKIENESQTLTHIEKAEEFIKDKKWDQAENEYVEALKLDMQSLEIYKKLANLYFQTKDLDKAQETYEYIVKIEPEDDYSFNKLGDIFKSRGDLNQAIENYKEAILNSENNANYYYNLATTNLKLEKLEDSLDNINQAINIEPDNATFLDFLINLSIIMEDTELGNKTLSRLIELDPDNKKITDFREKIEKM